MSVLWKTLVAVYQAWWSKASLLLDQVLSPDECYQEDGS
jgi:hypothetical protein